MNITRENYESFFLDYLEGSLDSSRMEEMHVFLERNPDLKAEMEEFEQVYLPADTILFPEKEQLKKNAAHWEDMDEQSFDHLYIAKLEGDLRPDEEKALDQLLLKQPQRRKELELYFKTKLKPLPVIFPDKLILKRKTSVFRQKSFWYSMSAAASIMLILVFSFILGRFLNPSEERTFVEVPSIESGDATVSEKVAAEEKEFTAAGDQQATEQIVHTEEFGTAESIDIVAMHVFEPGEQENESVSVDLSEIVADHRITMETLSMREYTPIHTNHYVALVIPESSEGENEAPADYLTLRELVARRLKRAVSAEESGESGREERITFLDIAEAGVRGVNRVSGSDMKLDRYYDENGDLTSYAFTSRTLSFSHEVKK